MANDTQTFQPQGYDWGNDIDFTAMVNSVADRFEQSTNMVVTYKARLALITPAIPHTIQVNQELKVGKITVRFLEDSVRKVLDLSVDFAMERNTKVIDESFIAASMKRYCPYLFWC